MSKGNEEVKEGNGEFVENTTPEVELVEAVAGPVDVIVEEITVTEDNELKAPLERVALADEEEIRIVISQNKGGAIMIHTKVAEEVKLTPSAVVGLMEVAKHDILAQQTARSQQNMNQQQAMPEGLPDGVTMEDMEPTDIELVENDLIVFPELKEHGMKAGDSIQLPRMTVGKLMEDREKANVPSTNPLEVVK